MSMTIREQLFALQDREYQKFQQKLIPNLAPDRIIGVRTPELRRLAKQISDAEGFKKELPHAYFEEDQLHSFLLAEGKDFNKTVEEVEAFLPYVDNWATCDQLRPRVFAKHREDLLPHVHRWITSGEPYTVRFGLEMLMLHYLDDTFDPAFLEEAACVQSDEYYVKMMVAWYFATALAKQYDATLPYITQHRLEKWTHNKTIQKAVESYRVLPEHKEILIRYRRKE